MPCMSWVQKAHFLETHSSPLDLYGDGEEAGIGTIQQMQERLAIEMDVEKCSPVLKQADQGGFQPFGIITLVPF